MKGTADSSLLGNDVGAPEGIADGMPLNSRDGSLISCVDGRWEGTEDGSLLGNDVGAPEGIADGMPLDSRDGSLLGCVDG